MNFSQGVVLLERGSFQGGPRLQRLAQRIEQAVAAGVYEEADELVGLGYDEDLVAQAARDEIDRALAAIDEGTYLQDAIAAAQEALRREIGSMAAFGESRGRTRLR